MDAIIKQIQTEAGLVAVLLVIGLVWQTRQSLIKEKRLKEWWEANNRMMDRFATALEENTKALTILIERMR